MTQPATPSQRSEKAIGSKGKGVSHGYAPSTFTGNQFIDREQYADQLRSSCPDDPELYRAWCEGDWAIVPYLARDQKRVEDVDSNGPDHAADAVRYGCLRQDSGVKLGTLINGAITFS